MTDFKDFHRVKDLQFDVKKLQEGLSQVLKIKKYEVNLYENLSRAHEYFHLFTPWRYINQEYEDTYNMIKTAATTFDSETTADWTGKNERGLYRWMQYSWEPDTTETGTVHRICPHVLNYKQISYRPRPRGVIHTIEDKRFKVITVLDKMGRRICSGNRYLFATCTLICFNPIINSIRSA